MDSELEHRERAVLQQYLSKFSFDDCDLADPLILKNGWLGEKDGIKLWPRLYFMDISRYFASVLGRENLLQRLECEYKEGKAYRYYANGFIGEVQSNMLDQNSKYCYFRTKCLPSQRVSAKQYDVWVICEKDRQQNCFLSFLVFLMYN